MTEGDIGMTEGRGRLRDKVDGGECDSVMRGVVKRKCRLGECDVDRRERGNG